MADRTKNVLDETTWEFLKTGWWISHILAIVIVAYLGFLFWPR
ncbi:MAG: hypothetical protein Q8P50_15920 [Bacillota bacterium]|nr:hypothetical protein [Bacillota bacterium]